MLIFVWVGDSILALEIVGEKYESLEIWFVLIFGCGRDADAESAVFVFTFACDRR